MPWQETNVPFDPYRPPRKSVRLPEEKEVKRCYFFTIVTWERYPFFGEVVGGRMRLSTAGKLIVTAWRSLPSRFPGVELDALAVMPDHVHGLLWREPEAATFSRVIRAFKALCTHELRNGPEPGFGWQRGLHLQHVYGSEALTTVRRYI